MLVLSGFIQDPENLENLENLLTFIKVRGEPEIVTDLFSNQGAREKSGNSESNAV